jgi:hypothetical protein
MPWWMGFLGEDFVILQHEVGENVKVWIFLSFEIVFSLSQLEQLYTHVHTWANGNAIIVYYWRRQFVYFVCQTEISLYHWKVLNEYGCVEMVLWWLDIQCKIYKILNNFFIENSIKFNKKMLNKLEHALDTIGKAFMSRILWRGFFFV